MKNSEYLIYLDEERIIYGKENKIIAFQNDGDSWGAGGYIIIGNK